MKCRIKRYWRAAVNWAEWVVDGIFVLCVLTFVVQMVMLALVSLHVPIDVSSTVGISMLLFWLVGALPALIVSDIIADYRERLLSSCCTAT